MAQELRLRRAIPGDEDRLALLGSATFLTAFADDHPGDALVTHCRTEHGAARYRGWLDSAAHTLWLVETALGAPVGYALLSPPVLDIPVEASALELKRIYALSGFQGAGIGAMLLAAVEQEARARGAEALYLCVYEVNIGAQRFYLRHGFEKVGEQPFMVGEAAFNDWVLRKALC